MHDRLSGFGIQQHCAAVAGIITHQPGKPQIELVVGESAPAAITVLVNVVAPPSVVVVMSAMGFDGLPIVDGQVAVVDEREVRQG